MPHGKASGNICFMVMKKFHETGCKLRDQRPTGECTPQQRGRGDIALWGEKEPQRQRAMGILHIGKLRLEKYKQRPMLVSTIFLETSWMYALCNNTRIQMLKMTHSIRTVLQSPKYQLKPHGQYLKFNSSKSKKTNNPPTKSLNEQGFDPQQGKTERTYWQTQNMIY